MNPSDEETLALLATDVDLYYERLVMLYWHQLQAFISQRVDNPQDAEDIVQDAFVRAYVTLERYTTPQRKNLKAHAWLYKITWNIYCNFAHCSKAVFLTPWVTDCILRKLDLSISSLSLAAILRWEKLQTV